MKSVIILIMYLVMFWNVFLKVNELRSINNKIPDNVSDIYDKKTYENWKLYYQDKAKLQLLKTCSEFVLLLLHIIFNLYSKFDLSNIFISAILVVCYDEVISLLITIPLNYYDTFQIEEKYGFNKSSKKTFVIDEIKGFIIRILINIALAFVYLGVHIWLQDNMIFLFAGVLFVIALAVTFLSPLFVKVFNKLTPLPDGELREKLVSLLNKNGYGVREIKVMDESRRSTRANAMFAGFGKSKTIILYDNLVNNFTPDEICAVFAHEMGHGMHKDTLKMQITSFLNICVLALFAWLIVRDETIFYAFGFTQINYGFAIILLGTILSLTTPLFKIVSNAMSRRAEYRADRQAVIEGYGDELISALKKLARLNYANLAPTKLSIMLDYNHPTISQRIDAILKAKEELKK